MLTSPVHKAPTLIACIPLIIGIKLSQHYAFSEDVVYFSLVVSALLVIVLQFLKTRRRSFVNNLHLALFIVVFFLLGFLRHQQENTSNDFEGSIKTTFSATILSVPVEKAKSYRIDLSLDTAFADSSTFAIGSKIISYMEKAPKVTALIPGQRIQFKSTLKPPSGIMNPEDFDYKSYLQHHAIFATTYIRSDDWHKKKDEQITLRIRAARVQNHVVSILQNLNYDSEEMALLAALTVGYKQMIGTDQRQAYIASGATHVLAVSGLHVGIIFLFLTRIFKVFGKSRKVVIIRLFIIISLLWCFAFITGLSPSVTRATLMFSLVSIGSASRQRSSIFNTVFLSAFLLLVYNPLLLFNIGFQLSYTAVLGIIAFQPYISKWFIEKLHTPRLLADLMGVSVAAQLGTFPIAIHAFNCFPNYFMLTNIWVIPLVGIIVNLAIILIIVSLIGLPNAWIAWPLGWLLKGMNMGVDFISQLPHSLITFLYFDPLTMVLLYAALIMLILALDYHSKRYLMSVLLLLICNLGINIYKMESRRETQQLMVFSDRQSFNVCAQQGNRCNILVEQDSTLRMPSYFTHQHLARVNINTDYLQPTYKDYNLHCIRDFIITPKHLHVIYTPELSTFSGKIQVTSCIINKQEPSNLYQLYDHIYFNTLVIYQRPEKHINYYRNFCEKNSVKLHLIYEEGAYLAEF